MTTTDFNPFAPTHELRGPDGRTVSVQWVDADEGGGAALYTEAEWAEASAADWEFDAERRGCGGW